MVARLPQSLFFLIFSLLVLGPLGQGRLRFEKTLTLAFQANGVAFLNCTFFTIQVTVQCAAHKAIGRVVYYDDTSRVEYNILYVWI